MRIAVYGIARDEEDFIERWGNSAAEADHILLLDTGSTDRTVEIARELSLDVHVVHLHPWRFDVARNTAMGLLPEDIDLCVSLDLDEILLPGWREALEALPSDVTRPRYGYVWSWNDDGSEGIVYGRDHIHTRHDYFWRHPVHEVLVPRAGVVEKTYWCDGLVVHHHPDQTKSRKQYLPLLKLAVEEDPDDDRLAFYYGRELTYAGQLDAAVVELERYLALPTATWAPERSSAMRLIAVCRPADREGWLIAAAGESLDRRESWVALAWHYHNREEWDACYATALRALTITERPMDYICEPWAWGSTAQDFIDICIQHLEPGQVPNPAEVPSYHDTESTPEVHP